MSSLKRLASLTNPLDKLSSSQFVLITHWTAKSFSAIKAKLFPVTFATLTQVSQIYSQYYQLLENYGNFFQIFFQFFTQIMVIFLICIQHHRLSYIID